MAEKNQKRKAKTQQQRSKKEDNIIFIYEVVPPEKTRFPKKLKKMNKLLRNAILLP
jgi:hypothetical protein